MQNDKRNNIDYDVENLLKARFIVSRVNKLWKGMKLSYVIYLMNFTQ